MFKNDEENYKGIQEIVDDAFEQFDSWTHDVRELQAYWAASMYTAINEGTKYHVYATQEIQRHQRLFSLILKKWWENKPDTYGTYVQ